MNTLKRLWTILKRIGAVLLPLSARARDSGAGAAFTWTVHGGLVLAGVLGLFIVNRWISDWFWGPYWLRRIWLPLFFLLLYALFWLGLWIWRLLYAEPVGSDFPDIDAAWDEALRALGQAGFALTDLPLFLVLGQPDGPEDHVFQGGQ